MKRIFITLLAIVAFSCTQVPIDNDGPKSVVPEDDSSFETPDNSGYTFKINLADDKLTSNELNIVGGLNRLGYSFASDLLKKGSSFVYSPLSLSLFLGFVSEGVDDETKEEIISAFSGDYELSGEQMSQFCLNLQAIVENASDEVSVNIANALFANSNSRIKETYKKSSKEFFDADLYNLDFANEKESLSFINGWAERKTNGLIKELLTQLNSSVTMYLMNALYFKAQWTVPFDNSLTSIFHAYGNDISSDFSCALLSSNYYEDAELQAVILDYADGSYYMTIALPREGKDIAVALNTLASNDIEFSKTPVIVSIPKFETESELPLNDALRANGFERLCNDAVFSGIFEEDYPAKISVKQKTRIKVDENGTEAAAVTYGGIYTSSGDDETIAPKEFIANRPFVYTICEKSTGAVMFVGSFTGK